MSKQQSHHDEANAAQPVDDEAPPEYEAIQLLPSVAQTTDDGRISINIDSKWARTFAKLIEIPEEVEGFEPPPAYPAQTQWHLPLNIVAQVVGSRGDVQPFVALGTELQNYGHRVRIATHNVFKDFVQSAGLEFYPIGGDPSELMAACWIIVSNLTFTDSSQYMVKNPGLIPNMSTLRSGDIQRKRQMIAEMLQGCWRSCIESDPQTGAPFVAHVIIANPVSFAHIHCAQALSIPLHLVFTMPWTPTRAYPHPLANIQNNSTDPKLANYLSYHLVQALTWQGLGDVINDFRKSLDLQVLPLSEAPFVLETLQINYTYCWSPALVPKPKDWGQHIDISGFIFRRPPRYEPPPELVTFLAAGPSPVYIGFGSIVVEDPDALLSTVLHAVKLAGVRAIISKGWSKLNAAKVPDNVFFIDDCPHEWLFQHVQIVVHHGGAGTCAAGLLYGRPTVIIPFFGDQPFWADRVAAAGAGPPPIPFKQLTENNLATAITYCLSPAVSYAAAEIAKSMRAENGVEAAVGSFHRKLPAEELCCDLVKTLPAAYRVSLKSGLSLKISAPAAGTLLKHTKIKPKHLKIFEANKFDIENRRWDPFSSAASSGIGTTYDMLSAFNEIWYSPYKMQKEAKIKAKAIEHKGETSPSANEDPLEGSSKSAKINSTAKLVGASAMSIPKFTGAFFKGATIDIPYAVAEGFRNSPKLYGEEVASHQPVTDWKSGAVVGGKEFVKGVGNGLADIFVQPVKGWKEDGAKGAILGVGKGAIGTGMKTSAGALGLWAYPVQGLWRSIYDATHDKTRKSILNARQAHDIYYAERDKVDEEQVLKAFNALAADTKQ